MKTRLSAVVCALAVTSAGLAVAQGQAVFPSDFANNPGDTYERRFPFSNGVSRMQALYESFDLQIPNGSQITHVGFRQDDGRTSAGASIQLEIYMGGTDLGIGTMTGNFANNYQNGTPRTLVFGPAIFALPAFASTTTQETVEVPLTTPYTFNAGENLVVEYVVLANNNANAAFNYYLDKGTYFSDVSSFGQGCPSSAGNTPRLWGSPAKIGANVTFSMDRAPASSRVWLNLSLIPTQPLLGDPFGAPGCTMLVRPQAAMPGWGSTSGRGSFSFPCPNLLAFYHQDVYGQVLVLDVFANALGFVASNGAQITVGADARMGTVMSAGNPAATTGSLRRSNGVISLFNWQ